MTNPWLLSHDDDHMSWIFLYSCMLSNPCRYLDEPNSMRLQLNHILSNLYISESLQNGGWRQGSTNPFNISFDKFIYIKFQVISNFMIATLYTQVLFVARLIHAGRWTSTTSGAPNSWWSTSTWAPYTSSSTWPSSSPPPKVCHSILEKLNPKTWVKTTQQDVNTSKCLNVKWQPHFELKRWVWPMIKCLHLTPKSIYSNVGDFVADQF